MQHDLRALTCLGDTEFKASLGSLNRLCFRFKREKKRKEKKRKGKEKKRSLGLACRSTALWQDFPTMHQTSPQYHTRKL